MLEELDVLVATVAMAPTPSWMIAGTNAKIASAKGKILLLGLRPSPNALRSPWT